PARAGDGAIGEGGVRVINDELVRAARVTPEEITAVEQREREDTGAPSPEIPRRTVSCQSHWPDRGRGGQRSRYRVYRPYIPQSGRDAARRLARTSRTGPCNGPEALCPVFGTLATRG